MGDQLQRRVADGQQPVADSKCKLAHRRRLLGVAPTNRDSGTLRGTRTTGGGRVELRNALYMPIIVAVGNNPKIKTFYQRLLDNGKPKMVALIAAMRKLITILNVMIREETSWNHKPTS